MAHLPIRGRWRLIRFSPASRRRFFSLIRSLTPLASSSFLSPAPRVFSLRRVSGFSLSGRATRQYRGQARVSIPTTRRYGICRAPCKDEGERAACNY